MNTLKRPLFLFCGMIVLGIFQPAAAQEILTKTYYWYEDDPYWIKLQYSYYLDAAGNEVLHGKYETWYDPYSGGKCTETDYSHGQINGYDRAWYPAGDYHWVRQYVNGMLNGTSQEWYDNAEPSLVAHYLDGKLHGSYITYDLT